MNKCLYLKHRGSGVDSMWKAISALMLLAMLACISTARAAERNDRALYNQAMARFNEKSYRKAISSFQELVRRYPGSRLRFNAIYQTGLCFERLHENAEAVRIYGELVKEGADTIWEARAHWRKAMAIEKESPSYSADDKEREDRRKSCIDEFRKSEEIYAKFPGFLDERCQMLLSRSFFEKRRLGADEKAIATARKAAGLNPSRHILIEALLVLGEIQRSSYEYKDAIRTFNRLLELKPDSKIVRDAMGEIKNAYDSLDEPTETLRWARKILERFPGDKYALETEKRITRPVLDLGTCGFFNETGDTAKFQIYSRNITEASMRAYRVDLVDLLSSVLETDKEFKMSLPEAPCAEWDIPINDSGDYRQVTTCSHTPFKETGAYVLEARSGGLSNRNLLFITDLALLCTYCNDGIVIFASHMKTGEPFEGVEIFSTEFGDHAFSVKPVGKTDRNGLFHFNTEKGIDDFFMIIGRNGSNSAFIPDLFTAEKIADSHKTKGRAYLYTDRPVYRPGQKVYFRGIARVLSDDVLGDLEDGKVEISITNPRNEEVYRASENPSEFGTVNGEYALPEKAKPGIWKITADVWGDLCSMEFSVEEYKKPEYIVTMSPGRPFYCPGEKAEVNLKAEYYSGGPVPGGLIRYSIFSHLQSLRPVRKDPFSWFLGEDSSGGTYSRVAEETAVFTGEAATDNKGKASFSFTVPQNKEDSVLRIEARVSDQSRREVIETIWLKAPTAPWYVDLSAPRYVKPGENTGVKINVQDLEGSPCSIPLEMKVFQTESRLKRVKNFSSYENVITRELLSQKLQTGNDGSAEWMFKPETEGGIRILAVTPGSSAENSAFFKDLYVRESSLQDKMRHDGVLIESERNTYSPGEKAIVSIIAINGGNSAFVEISGKSTKKIEVIPLKENKAVVEIPVDEGCVPCMKIGAAVVKDGYISCNVREFMILPRSKFLNIDVMPDHETCDVGGKSNITLSVRNSDGKPVKAELSLDLVDLSLFAVKEERSIDIKRFFYGSDYHYYRWEPHSMNDFSLPLWQVGLNKGLFGLFSQLACFCPPPPPLETMSTDALKGDSSMNLVIRRNFPDTAFWSANILTDDKGMAKVSVPLPDSLTTWRARAIGVTKDTKVGSATVKINTRKDLFVRLEMPRFLVQKDESMIVGIVHNNTDKALDLKAVLEADGLELLEPTEKKLSVQAGKEVKAEWRIRAVKAGKAGVCIKALVQGHSDAVALPLPIHPHGIEESFHNAGEAGSGKSATLALELPPSAIPETTSCELVISPSLASVVMESLDYLESYPYWCNEQATSRLYPFMLTRKMLAESGIRNIEFERRCSIQEEKCVDCIRRGQNGDGGWGWWSRGESCPEMTSYVLMGLKEAMDCGTAFDSKSIEKAVFYLKGECRKAGMSLPDDKATMLHAISLYGKLDPPERNVVLRLYCERDRLSDYGRPLLLMLLEKIGEKNKMGILISNLEDRAQIMGNMAFYGAGQSIAHQKVEETAGVLMALEKVRPDHPLIRKMINYLASAREGNHWETTVDTAKAVSAITHHMIRSGDLACEYPVLVSLNGKKIFDEKVTKENILNYPGKIRIPASSLKIGKNEWLIEPGEQCRSILFSSMLKTVLLQEDIPADGELLTIKREFVPLESSGENRATLKEVRSRERFKVRITMEAQRDLNYLVLEDPRPAGCEVPAGSFDEEDRQVHRELHDDRAVFFFYSLSRGVHTIEYTLRAETPGNYHVMPATLSMMYMPSIQGRSAESRITVK